MGRKMEKFKRNASLLRKISKVRLDVEVPEETEELRPLAGPRGVEVEETRIGTAKIEGEDTPYLKVGLKVSR
jgi:hypothetical protein